MRPIIASERLAVLREALARLTPPGAGWERRQTLKITRPALTPLFASGQVFGALHEIVAAAPRDGAAALGFALDFLVACAQARPQAGLVLILEDYVTWETGLPYGPGLARAGLDPARLILVRTGHPRETLLAAETALRARGIAGVLTESAIPPRLYDLATSRRLLLAARTGGAAGLFLPVALAGQAERMSSAATARFEIARAPSRAVPFGRGRLPMPGRPAFYFRLLKAPGGLTDAAARNRERWETGVSGVPFDEAAFHAFSFDPSSLSTNGSRAPAGEGEFSRRRA